MDIDMYVQIYLNAEVNLMIKHYLLESFLQLSYLFLSLFFFLSYKVVGKKKTTSGEQDYRKEVEKIFGFKN